LLKTNEPCPERSGKCGVRPHNLARVENPANSLLLQFYPIAAQIETYKSREQQVQQSQARLTYAQQEFERARQLVSRGAATQPQLDAATRDQQVAARTLAGAQAEASAALAQIGGDGGKPIEQRPQYLAAQAKLQDAQRNLRLTQVVAPFAGIATNVNAIAPGAFLSSGQQAISMVANQSP
jgi:membrane fusion protein, multidrug efflux system